MEKEILSQKVSKGTKFVEFILKQMEQSTAVGAILRRADNPATEYQAWEFLSKWCDLDNTYERTCYATIAASLAHSKKTSDMNIGQVIARCYPDGNQDDSAKRKLRRLLACDTSLEVCQWLRPILRLASSRGITVNYGKLLEDLLYFNPKVKEKWAVDFYGKKGEANDSVSS